MNTSLPEFNAVARKKEKRKHLFQYIVLVHKKEVYCCYKCGILTDVGEGEFISFSLVIAGQKEKD
jgi:hypothetical protein